MLRPYYIFTISILVVIVILAVAVFTPLQRDYLNTDRTYTMKFQYISNAPVDVLKITNSTYRTSQEIWIERGVYHMEITIKDDPNLTLIVYFNSEAHIFRESTTKYVDINSGPFIAIGYLSSESGYAEIKLERVSWP